MNKYVGNIVIAAAFILIPFLGLPISWKEYVFVVLGIMSTLFSVLIYREHLMKRGGRPVMHAEVGRTYIDNE